MPLYEFVCEACGRRFEALKRLSDRTDEEACPECGRAAPRVMSGFAVGGEGRSGGGGAPPVPACGGGG